MNQPRFKINNHLYTTVGYRWFILYTMVLLLFLFFCGIFFFPTPSTGQSNELVYNRDSGAYFDSSTNFSTSLPLQYAWNDFRRDWYKVIGSVIVLQPELPSTNVPYGGGAYFAFYINDALPSEAFTINAVTNNFYSYLEITGGDTRGLVFAMYHVSCDILGVDPMWWFQDLNPQYANTVTVMSNYSYWSGAPVYTSRGAFINDEDISGYFFTDPVGDSIYSADAAAYYAEALLRLRVNTVIPSTFGYVDERHYRTFADRGFIMSQHHVMPMGVNTYAWPLGVPYTYRLNPEPLINLWESLVDYQSEVANRDMIYSVGYRGLNDYPFWQDDTACNTTQCRGEVISNAIGNQTAIIRSIPTVPGKATPRIVTFLQMEMLALKQAGVLILPSGVSTIWTDFDACFQIQGIENATDGDGFYAHLAAMSGWPYGGSSGQLTEWATISRAFANMWQMWMKNATSMGMINLSDIKQVPLTAEAVFRYLWNPAAFNATSADCPVQPGTVTDPVMKSAGRRIGPRGPVGWWPSPAALAVNGSTIDGCSLTVTPLQAETNFFLEFATRHYGTPTNATGLPAAVASIHANYFNLPYLTPVWPMGDHYFGTTMRQLLQTFQGDVQSNNHNDGNLYRSAQGMMYFADGNLSPLSTLFNDFVLPLQASIAPGGPSNMYAHHIVAQIAIHYYHTQAFQTLASAVMAWNANNIAATEANVSATLQYLDTCLDYMRAGEGQGRWSGMYATETWTFVVGTRGRVAFLLGTLRGTVIPQPQPDVYADGSFMNYECPQHDMIACNTFPLSAFNATIAWDVMVRITCAQDAPTTKPGLLSSSKVVKTAIKHVHVEDKLHPSRTQVFCSTGLMGVTYGGSSTNVALFTAFSTKYRGQNAPLPVIRYTLDGSSVEPGSTLYTVPFTVTGNVTVKARAFDSVSATPYASESLALISQVSTT